MTTMFMFVNIMPWFFFVCAKNIPPSTVRMLRIAREDACVIVNINIH